MNKTYIKFLILFSFLSLYFGQCACHAQIDIAEFKKLKNINVKSIFKKDPQKAEQKKEKKGLNLQETQLNKEPFSMFEDDDGGSFSTQITDKAISNQMEQLKKIIIYNKL